jgi:hypothetical protein
MFRATNRWRCIDETVRDYVLNRLDFAYASGSSLAVSSLRPMEASCIPRPTQRLLVAIPTMRAESGNIARRRFEAVWRAQC